MNEPQQPYEPRSNEPHAPQPQPYAPPAPQAPDRRRLILPIAITAGAVLVIGSVVTALLLFSTPKTDENRADRAHSSEAETDRDPSPKTERPQSESDTDDELDYGPDDPEIDGTGPVADRLQALEDRYQQMYDDGSLWDLMPETKENTGAYLAFQFMLTDMRSATRFSTDEEQETQFAKHAKRLEERLLAQQPLGSDVTYVLQDGRTFTYDGETGEVGLE